MRATNNEKRTLQPVTALTNFAASTILDRHAARVDKPFQSWKGILRMSPRRSPRFIEPSPKPELPKKPRQPKRVENPVEDSVRRANFQVELAEW